MNYKKMYATMRDENSKLLYMYEQIKNQINPVNSLNFSRAGYDIMLKASDRVQCANRYAWKLPKNVNTTSQQVEALYYDYGALAFFEYEGKLHITKFAMQGQLNDIGILDKIQPIGFNGETYPVMKGVIAGRGNPELIKGEPFAVIIFDYTTLAQSPDEMARAQVNANSTIKSEVDCYAQLFNNIKLSTKKMLGICESEEQKRVLEAQVESMLSTATPVQIVTKTRSKGVKVASELPVEMFNMDTSLDMQNLCQTIDFYNKKRRAFNGIPSPDTFEKKERKITAEAENSNVYIDLTLYDGLMQRKYGVELLKKYARYPETKEIDVDYSEVIKPYIKPEKEKENDNKIKNNEVKNEQ